MRRTQNVGFNPFFIRASVYCCPKRPWTIRRRPRFNPFFIRASVYCHQEQVPDSGLLLPVSIPSSSGHQFTGRNLISARVRCLPRFQSLLHQGISLLMDKETGATGIKTVFQSLLHQGISLLLIGNLATMMHRVILFQSLLHQGISLLRYPHGRGLPVSQWFQSLLHQGISLLPVCRQMAKPY